MEMEAEGKSARQYTTPHEGNYAGHAQLLDLVLDFSKGGRSIILESKRSEWKSRGGHGDYASSTRAGPASDRTIGSLEDGIL